MKNLDLEKVIIILSLLLMPVAGFWIWSLTEELKVADSAMQPRAMRTTIKEIYRLQDLIDRTNRELNKPGESAEDFQTYFRNRAMQSQKGTPILRREEITVNQGRVTPIRVARQVIGEDIEVKVALGKGQRGGKALPRDFINAFVVNSESGSPIWKLRNFKIVNQSFKGLRNRPPPLETEDRWFVNDVVFARSRPVAAK